MTEYLAENSRLRQLSRRYAEGQLALEEYRAERRAIIEALEAGQVQKVAAPLVAEKPPEFQADATDMRPANDETLFLKTMPPHIPVPESGPSAAQAEAAGWDLHTRILAAVLGVSLLLAVGALVYVFAL